MPLKPKALKPGDTIGIAASASPFDPAEFEAGIATLESLGFRVSYRPDIFEKKNYLAGSDDRRFDELTGLLTNPKIRAVFFARGGYGMMRLLPKLRRWRGKMTPKIVLGYSDITSLLMHLSQNRKWVTFYGPVVARDMGRSILKETKQFLLKAVTETKSMAPLRFEESFTLQKGSCEGEMVGGCLSLVVASLGTPFEIDTKNKILFLEDVNEKPYSVDRMLTQLVLAGKLKGVRGILFGHFVNGGEAAHFRETIGDVFRDFKAPILCNFPAGHGSLKVTLPLGIKARLSADKKTLTYLEPACLP